MPSCQTFIWVHLAKSPLHMVKSIAEYACGLQKHTGSVLSLARLRFVMVPVECDLMMMAKVGVGRPVMWQLAVHVTMLVLFSRVCSIYSTSSLPDFPPYLVLSRCPARTIWLRSSGRDWDWSESPGCWLGDCFPLHPERRSVVDITKFKSIQSLKTFMHHWSISLLTAAIDISECIIVATSTKGWPWCMLLARGRKLIAVRFPTNGSSYSKQHDSTRRGCSTAVEKIVRKKIIALGCHFSLFQKKFGFLLLFDN